MAGTATPPTRAVHEARVPFVLHEYEPDPRAPSYGLEAAARLVVDADRVLDTLIATVDGDRLVVGVIPARWLLDLEALARAVAGRRAVLAPPGAAERATGYPTGGISPLGQRRRLPTVVEEMALEFDTVFVSAGRRGLEIELAPADLVALTSARAATVAR
jgi:Cys-tRNA(Pro)/Cys-tRNA(Cys) deacylase